MFSMKEFGKRLRQAREQAGLTGVQVAVGMYTTQGSISRYEAGLVYPRIDRVYEFARLYGVSIDWLCGLGDET